MLFPQSSFSSHIAVGEKNQVIIILVAIKEKGKREEGGAFNDQLLSSIQSVGMDNVLCIR